MPVQLLRTDSTNPDFLQLVALLDADLAQRDGDEHAFYAQLNTVDSLRHVIVLREEDKPVACGAFRPMDEHSVEIKRMFTLPEARGRGLASQTLAALESWARELGYDTCRLETGIRQPEAIALYNRNGYARIPNYGKYAGIANSVCFEKNLSRIDPPDRIH